MKKAFVFLIILLLFDAKSSKAQSIITDSIRMRTWHVSKDFAKRQLVEPDTAKFNYQIINPIFRESLGNTYNGNLGSPYISQIYFNRNYQSDFIFMHPYNAYMTYPNNFYFYNTKGPYTNFAYYSGGSQQSEEENVDFMFTENVNPHWNIAGAYHQIYGRGQYSNQSTNHMGYDFSSNYISNTYNMYVLTESKFLRNKENGGISNDYYITNPQLTGDNFSDPRQIPVNLATATSSVKNRMFYFGQSYNLNMKVIPKGDSIPRLLPFATISHTLAYETNEKIFNDPSDTGYFVRTLGLDTLIATSTDDNTIFQSMKNTLAIDMNEDINRWAKFGMGAFIELEQRTYQTEQANSDTLGLLRHSERYTVVGGRIYKTHGAHIRYDVTGRMHVQGSKLGDFNLNGTLNTSFKLLSHEFEVNGAGEFSNTSPDYLQNHYFSNYFEWDNNFSKILKTRFSGEIAGFPNRSRIYASVENTTNYIYFGNDAKPTQYNGNLQIVAVGAEMNLRRKSIHLDNHLIFQQTTNSQVLPLPKLTLYTNLYYSGFWFNVLTVQMGVEARYFSSYNAPDYMVPIGQYYTQQDMKVGGFPVISPYANFHLKRMRFFLKWYHINDTMSSPHYFSLPHYPIDPNIIKIGFSWNFYS